MSIIKYVILTLLIISLAFSIVGCKKTNSEKQEDPTMVQNDVTQSLAEQLGCSERTATSILQTISEAGVENIVSAEAISSDAYILVEVKTYSNIYYVTMGLDYFVESIREGSTTGTVIYRDMQ